MSVNKKTGTDFEKEFCVLASQKVFWAHRLNENVNGQPADVILCRNDIPALIDCKVCDGKKFLLSRIEENQELAMSRWLETGNMHAYFAIKIENEIFLIHFEILMIFKNAGFKQLTKEEIKLNGFSFDVWEGRLNEN